MDSHDFYSRICTGFCSAWLMMSVSVRFGTYPGAYPKLSWLPLSQQERPNCWILSQSFVSRRLYYREISLVPILSPPPSWMGTDISMSCAVWALEPVNFSADAHQFSSLTHQSSSVASEHQRRRHKHGPNPWSRSQWDSPCYKIWRAVSDFLLRRAKRKPQRSLGRRRVHRCALLYIFGVCARSGNPTKWACCITAGDTRP